MKLSEILNWNKPETLCPHQNVNPKQLCLACESNNDAIKDCDREIDEEALYQVILDTYRKNGSVGCLKEYKKKIIKSMPTWLKRIEK